MRIQLSPFDRMKKVEVNDDDDEFNNSDCLEDGVDGNVEERSRLNRKRPNYCDNNHDHNDHNDHHDYNNNDIDNFGENKRESKKRWSKDRSIYNYNNIRLISGSSNPALSQMIADELKITLTKCDLTTFANTETRIQLRESVRGKHVYIVQTGGFDITNHKSVNDYIFESMLIMDSVRGAGAKSITILCPCYPYARQDKKDAPRAPISARVVATSLQSLGLTRIICIDLHAASIQGLFNCPCDNLYCINPIKDYLYKNVFMSEKAEDYSTKFVAISPDEGAIKRTSIYAGKLNLKFMVMSKTRDYNRENVVEKTVLLGNPEWLIGRTAVIFDDMIDTGGTVIKSVEYLIERGAKDAVLVVSHGILSGAAIERINNCSAIKAVVVSDSLCQINNLQNCPKLQVFTVSKMYADVVKRLVTGESISEMFE